MIETRPQRTQERALLIGLEKEGVSKWDLQDSLEELRELASSAGAKVVDTVTQKLPKPTAPYYIGRGKAELIKDSCQNQQVTSVIFNDELSPAQGRNLENLFARKVLDRTQLILDIFAQRARSREGRLQIELAQLQYLLPRLTRMWHHLSRQTGGIGTRGPGETQLEVDRRRVQERIARLERELEAVRKTRAVQRQGRKRHQWPVAAVVGYTNAGKSTLLNLLTGADVVAVDKLLAGPATAVRRVHAWSLFKPAALGIQESLARCVRREFLPKMRRNMRDDQGVVAIITQFQDVTHAMDLCNERRLIGRNSKT